MFLNNTNSETFEDCNRKFYWSREHEGIGLESVYSNDNLSWGTVFHLGLANFYSNDPEYILNSQVEAKEFLQYNNLTSDERAKWNEHLSWIGNILKEYKPFAAQNDDFTVIQIESEGCVVLGEICYKCGEPYERNDEEFTLCPKCESEIHHYVFRVDLAVNRGEHVPKVNIIDHKTAGSLGDTYLLSWHNSLQMFGYCYGYQKASGVDVSGYIVNVIRKLKSVGRDKDPLIRCTDCRNGSKKRMGCLKCVGTGQIAREYKDVEQPFVREYESWDSYKQEIFLRQRIGTAKRIQQEKKLFKTRPDEAWPMNPKSCFKMGRCPFWKLCYNPNDPEKWYQPSDNQLVNFESRQPDYVTVRQMAREEMI